MFFVRLVSASVIAAVIFLSWISPSNAQYVDRQGAVRLRLGNQDFGYIFSSLTWPKESSGETVIFVCWEAPTLTNYPKETQWVRSAIKDSWEKFSRIQFRGWADCAEHNAGIRIVVIKSGPRVNAFGRELDDRHGGMELNFTFESWSLSCKETEGARELCIRSIAVHEFGHALGFAHEQDRADTPGECAERHGTGTTGQDLIALTPYDPASVMNYCNTTYNNNGKLSIHDIESIQKVYGASTR